MICCALMIEANCILMFMCNIFNGSISPISLTISSVSFGRYFANSPCLKLFLFFLIFSGGAPVDLPPCMRQRPFFIAQFLHLPPFLVLAPHLFLIAWGLFCIYIHTTVLICILSIKKAPRRMLATYLLSKFIIIPTDVKPSF